MDACIAPAGWFINNKLYMITGENIEKLISYLNSKLFNRIILKFANITGGKGVDFMETIPVPPVELLQNTEDDQYLYSVFNLDEEERLFIENVQ